VNALRLPHDVAARDRTIHSCGLIEGVSIIPMLWESNVYSGLLSALRDLNYQSNEIVLFDYDWRLSNFDNAAILRDKIRQLRANGADKVDIVAHSMGGLIARIVLQNMNGFDDVHNVIFLGTPHLGSARIFQNLRDGFDNWPNAWAGGLQEIQKTILSFPATYELLPTYTECCAFVPNGDVARARYFDILEPDAWKRLTWLPSDLRSGPGFEALATHLAGARRLKSLMQAPLASNPDDAARIHFIGNGFLNTWSRVFFDETTGKIVSNILRPGDGTVLLFSATAGNPGQVQISKREHALVFMGEEPGLIIKAVLGDSDWHRGSGDFSQTLVDAGRRQFRVQSASLDVTPRFAKPGDAITVRIELVGPTLEQADLSHAQAVITDAGVVIAQAPVARAERSVGRQTVVLELTAPTMTGAYELRLTIPGIEGLAAIIATMAP
jgi:pimeloyl-ACP methyl ester carboxylesterase